MLASFDEVYVVSDLHLGGLSGFQIFNQGPLLAATIDALCARDAARVGLVLNGDIVDFLAEEPGSKYLDPEGATNKLDRISKDPAFAPVWEALRRFLGVKGRRLVLVLGNHDVELALPNVREWVAQSLCTSDKERGRLVYAVDGGGYSCEVGGRRVLCLHGNEVDVFNVVDHRQLLEVSRALNRSTEIPEWTPNAGTKLVIDVMNDLKRTWRFIDLLKPEGKAAVPVLLAVDPSQSARIGEFLPIARRLVGDAIRSGFGLLGEDGVGQALDAEQREHASTGDLEDVLLQVEADFEEGREPLALVDGEADTLLGLWDDLRGLAGGTRRLFEEQVLRRALRAWLGDGDMFEVTAGDRRLPALDAAVGADVDFLLAGHTHKRRALHRPSGNGFYYNSGTWIRLIQLDPDVLEDPGRFAGILNTLREQSMAALDAHPGLVRLMPTVVALRHEGARVVGALLEPAQTGGDLRLDPIADSRHEMEAR